jgi:hypothetical protein
LAVSEELKNGESITNLTALLNLVSDTESLDIVIQLLKTANQFKGTREERERGNGGEKREWSRGKNRNRFQSGQKK